MKTNVYIDGFNFYYGALEGTPHRWLDVSALCQQLLPNDTIHRIRYYTASVRPRRHDPDQRTRQKTYWRALRTVQNLTIHEGHFLSHKVTMPLASNPSRLVEVIKTEEKGSDVNIAAHLLRDAYNDDYELGVLVTNDSDLLEPIRIVRRELNKPVGILNPQRVETISDGSSRFVPGIAVVSRAAQHRPWWPRSIWESHLPRGAVAKHRSGW